MDTGESNIQTGFVAPSRQKRRLALACDQCRRRKIKCDRNVPCRQCTKANLKACLYVKENRITPTMAPFEGEETQFYVFDQSLNQQLAKKSSSTTTSTSTTLDLPLSPSSSDSQSGTYESFHDQDMSQYIDLCLSEGGVYQQIELNVPSSPVFLYPSMTASVQGVFLKDRFYGQSHYLNYLPQSSQVLATIQNHEANDTTYGVVTFANCKKLGRALKARGSSRPHSFNSFRDMVPARDISDLLVQAYLRTFQTVLGILDVPSFRRDYDGFWHNQEATSEEFLCTLILVMCVGSVFTKLPAGLSRESTQQWIDSISTWLNMPESNLLLNLSRLRIQCLLYLIYQDKSVKQNKVRLSRGTMLHMAMQLGLHIDLEKHQAHTISASDLESRRRLWATVLELELQSSMDCGSLFAIDSDEYDCDSILNVDDASLQAKTPVLPKPMDQLTQSSFQILLMKTMPSRLKIARFINKFRAGDSYDQVLSLSTDLLAAMKSCTVLIEAYRMSSSPPTAFQTQFFDILVHRFLLGLHHPFAVKAMTNPLYYYSRKICRETALSLLSPSTHTSDDDFHKLRLLSNGPFLNVYRQCALYMCRELLNPPEADSPFSTDTAGRLVQEEARKAVQRYTLLARDRIEAGDTSIKCYVLVCCLLAQAEAEQTGAPAQPRILVALKRSLETCHSLLNSCLQRSSGLADLGLVLTTPIDDQFDWSQWNNTIAVSENPTELSSQAWAHFGGLGI